MEQTKLPLLLPPPERDHPEPKLELAIIGAGKPPRPLKSPKNKPEKVVKIVYREPELSDRAKMHREFLKSAIQIKKEEFQNWPTHMEVQGARVYKQAGDLMASCTEYKMLKKEGLSPRRLAEKQDEQVQALIEQCHRNIAANIRFLEKLVGMKKTVTYQEVLGPTEPLPETNTIQLPTSTITLVSSATDPEGICL